MIGKWIYSALGICLVLLTCAFYTGFLAPLLLIGYIIFLCFHLSPRLVAICVTMMTLTAFYYVIHDNRNQSSYTSSNRHFIGIIATTPDLNGDILRFQVNTEREKLMVRYKIQTKQQKDHLASVTIGMKCRLKGDLVSPENNRNESLFNYKQYLYRQSVHWVLQANESPQCERETKSMVHTLFSVRDQGIKQIKENMSEPASSFMQAMIYGERKDIDERVLDDYQKGGIIHLIAISGQHVSLLVAMFFYLLIRFGVTRERAITCILIALPFYMFIAGASPSVVRACITAFLVMGSLKFNHLLSPLDAISFSFIIMIIIDPYAVFHIGFQLSYVVTLFLILSAGHLLKLIHHPLLLLLQVTFIAQLASLPLILYYFFEFSLSSFLLNLIFVPLFSFIILPLCLLILPCLVIFPTIAFVLGWVLQMILLYSNELVAVVARLKVLSLLFGKPSIWFVALFYGVTIWFLYEWEAWKNGRWKVAIAVLFFSYTVHYFVHYFHPYGRVSMIDVGQGDSILIELPFRKATYLIDTGGQLTFPVEEWQQKRSEFSIGDRIVIPYLKSRGIRRIDKLILTHGDTDHGGEGVKVLTAFPTSELLLGEKKEWSQLERTIVALAKRKKTNISVVRAGDGWKEGDARFSVLSPIGDEPNQNEASIVLYGELGPYKWLFTGDLGVEEEHKLVRRYPNVQVDVLKVGHHGSRSSTSREFLEHIQPKLGLLSVGKDNRYGHPHGEVVALLQEHGVNILRSDKNGQIIYSFSRKSGTFRWHSP